ncbi:MAG: 50S ribosomal protein L3 [Euryarchaeota archaeon]|nr:50S ribosomal protein L3 [Euryarchaeota archaeon]
MGKKAHHPHRGSLGYSPRKRAASPVPRIRTWVAAAEVGMQGFAGYKAGMTHVVRVDDYPHSITHGQEITVPATVLETPPLAVFGVRLYSRTTNGLRTLTERWAENIHKNLGRVLRLPKNRRGAEDIESYADRVAEVRLLVHTQPWMAGIGKKTPEVMEYLVSGSPEEALKYASEKLGKEIGVAEVFSAGEIVDVIAVTKGKGFQSSVRRWGVKILHHKTRKGRRRAGTLGPWHPSAMMWSVPQSGQMGYHHRTEFNKRILGVGSEGVLRMDGREVEITPPGGFLSYGVVKSDFVLLEGSVPGARKRLVRLRPAVRPPKRMPEGEPKLVYVSTSSKQGV